MSKKHYKKAAKTAKKVAKRYPKVVLAIAILLVLLIVAGVVLYKLKPELFEKLLPPTTTVTPDEGTTGGGSTGGEVVDGEVSEITTSKMSVHFLMLGNKFAGDSVLIKVGDTEVLIDAGSRTTSASTLVSYINTYCTDGILEYVIATHADQDHIAAFYPTGGIFDSFECRTIIDFARTDKSTATYNNYVTARDREVSEGGAVHYTARECYEETGEAKRQYYLDDEETISLNILYNYYYYNNSSDENNYSVVSMITEERAEGDRHYLFTGDLEEDGESRLVDYYAISENSKSEFDILPKVDLYKAGHHGSKTSSTAKLMEVIQPQFVAVCCCCGSPEYTVNNNNTFPTQEAIDHIAPYTDKIYVTTLATNVPELNASGQISDDTWDFTPMNGNIVFYSTGTDLKLYCSNNTTILKDTEWFASNRVWNV